MKQNVLSFILSSKMEQYSDGLINSSVMLTIHQLYNYTNMFYVRW